MKDILSKVASLSRTSLQDLKKIFSTTKTLTIIDSINTEDEEENSYIEIPYFGRIQINKDLDFEFIPDINLKKDIFTAKQDPEKYLKKELKKLLKIEDNINE